jgi:hypothetical protein
MSNNNKKDNHEEEVDESEDEQLEQIQSILNEIRNKFVTDLAFEALMAEYFKYSHYMLGAHYEEGTLLDMEGLAKEAAEEDWEEFYQQVGKMDRGGPYSGSERMK